MKVLIVEDDINLAKALGYILKEKGYSVELSHDGQDCLDKVKKNKYDIIVLDIMLPKIDGYTVCKQIRKDHINTPIIMLTAKDNIKSKIEGLDSGADDYMTKPFSPAELLAHLRALTRRNGEIVFETINYIDLELNIKSYELTCKGKTVRLSYKEFCIMKILMQNKGQIASKKELIEEVWGNKSYAEDNNVEAYISFIRKKLKFLETETKIQTIRKAGYRLISE